MHSYVRVARTSYVYMYDGRFTFLVFSAIGKFVTYLVCHRFKPMSAALLRSPGKGRAYNT